MQSEKKSFFTTTAGIIVAILLILCCCCVVVLASGLGGVFYLGSRLTPFPEDGTPYIINLDNSTPTPIVITRVPVQDVPLDTLGILEKTGVPQADLNELACRLKALCGFSQVVPSGPHKVGDTASFWVYNVDNHKNFKVNASLPYVTEHVYFWVADGVKFDMNKLQKLADTFETKIYPTDRAFFGSEWSPGIDNDAHIYVLLSPGLGRSIAGYFSSVDEYPTQAHKYSNAHEMFNFNADNIDLGAPFTYGVLAHEFQHMIHWYQDRNESTWMNEGFSEVASFLNGYYVGGFDSSYIANTDLQLNDWSPSSGANRPHYGASFLFLAYFLDRFGEETTKSLVHNPLNGLESMDDTLKTTNTIDKTTGKIITSDDVFADWAVTNFLQDGSVGDGRYVYHNYPDAPMASARKTISACPSDAQNSTVRQYGVDYINIDCIGEYTLHFEGSNETGLLPVKVFSGKYAFWSNKGDTSDMTLTREFDFSAVSAPLSMEYQTWYDLEKNFDYVYLEASTDNGQHWQILKTTSGTDINPSGNSYGWGYNAKSGGNTAVWIPESLDLSAYAGQKVSIRFEYITDAAVNGEGFMVDDISVPALHYSTDFEKDDGGWQASGFARVQNTLPQTYRLELIVTNSSGATVQNIEMNPDATADIPLTLQSGEIATLVVSGTTRFTREDAHYSISVK